MRHTIRLLVLMMVGVACTGGPTSSPQGVDALLSDGSVTDGELEQAWVLVEECLRAKGIDAVAEVDPTGRWGVTIGGDFLEDAAADCISEGDRVTNAYLRERIPEGAERLELAASLEECLGEIGVDDVPYDPNNPSRDHGPVVAQAIEQLGHEPGSDALLADPRFDTVLDCIDKHALLWPEMIPGLDLDE